MSMTTVYIFAVLHVTLANGTAALPDSIEDQEGVFATMDQCKNYAKVINEYHASWSTPTDKWYIGACKEYAVDMGGPKSSEALHSPSTSSGSSAP